MGVYIRFKFKLFIRFLKHVVFDTSTKWDATDNSLCETFNSNIVLTMTRPIVDMLDDIRSQFVEGKDVSQE